MSRIFDLYHNRMGSNPLPLWLFCTSVHMAFVGDQHDSTCLCGYTTTLGTSRHPDLNSDLSQANAREIPCPLPCPLHIQLTRRSLTSAPKVYLFDQTPPSPLLYFSLHARGGRNRGSYPTQCPSFKYPDILLRHS